MVAFLLLAVFLICAASAGAQDQGLLQCGMALRRDLPAGGEHVYRLNVPADAWAVLQTSALSMSLGPRRMRLTGGGLSVDTPTGIIRFQGRSSELTLRVTQNNGNTGGAYVVSLNIISQSGANCGYVLPCGATPDGIKLDPAGEVESIQVPMQAGERTTLRLNYTDGSRPRPYLRLYDPAGNEMIAGTCTGSTQVVPPVTGTYTALVSACELPVERAFRLDVLKPDCPDGPTITHFGLTDAATSPLEPSGLDGEGRPIYAQEFGSGKSLVVEARAGSSGLRPGLFAIPDGGEPADLQVIMSRPLGDGDPRICDISPPDFGGVPATVPFSFDLTPATLDRLHDMGCRFDNGQGEPIGRIESAEACTTTPEGGFSFVDRGSAIQYCAQIASAWAFPDGDTIVGARVRDSAGNYGEPREIVIRIGSGEIPTPTATPTRTVQPTNTPPFTLPPTRTETRTKTPTRTRTIGPPGTATETPTPNGCPGDCGGSRTVTIDEITVMLNISFGNIAFDQCPAGDANNDGEIKVSDLIRAVTSLLEGCT